MMRAILPLDEIEDCSVSLVMVTQALPIGQIVFQGSEKARGHGIVIAISNQAHRQNHAPSPTTLAEGEGGGLAALVRAVDNQCRVALLHGYVQGLDHEPNAQMLGHRSTHHPAAGHVDDDSRGQAPGQGRYAGDVSHPADRGGRVESALNNQARPSPAPGGLGVRDALYRLIPIKPECSTRLYAGPATPTQLSLASRLPERSQLQSR